MGSCSRHPWRRHWADEHADQIAFLEDGIVLYSRIDEVLVPLFDDPESVDLGELEELLGNLVDWVGRGPALNAAFSYQFADYFEGLA